MAFGVWSIDQWDSHDRANATACWRQGAVPSAGRGSTFAPIDVTCVTGLFGGGCTDLGAGEEDHDDDQKDPGGEEELGPPVVTGHE